MPLDAIIVIVEVNVTRTLLVLLDEVLVTRGSLVLGVPSEHTLDAHADAFHILDRAPSLRPEQIKTNDSVRVDVRVHRYRSIARLHEGHFRRLFTRIVSHNIWHKTMAILILRKQELATRTYRVSLAELELEAECFICVNRVLVENLNVKKPFFEIVGRHQHDARR
jgi:hypothetical protein